MNLKKIQIYFITKKMFNGAAIFIIITYKLSENIQELFKGGEFIFSILNTISYSILASSCFYLIYEYFPKKEREGNSQKILFPRLEKFIVRLDRFLYWFDEIIIFDEKSFVKSIKRGKSFHNPNDKTSRNIVRDFNYKKDLPLEVEYIYSDIMFLLNNPLNDNVDAEIKFILHELSLMFTPKKRISNSIKAFTTRPRLLLDKNSFGGLTDDLSELKYLRENLFNVINNWEK